MNAPTFSLSLTADQLDAILDGLARTLDAVDAAPRDYERGYRDMVDALALDLTRARWPKR